MTYTKIINIEKYKKEAICREYYNLCKECEELKNKYNELESYVNNRAWAVKNEGKIEGITETLEYFQKMLKIMMKSAEETKDSNDCY